MWLKSRQLVKEINRGTTDCRKAISLSQPTDSYRQNLFAVSYLMLRRNTSKLRNIRGMTSRNISMFWWSLGTKSQFLKTPTIRRMRSGSRPKPRMILITGISFQLGGRRLVPLSQLLSTNTLPCSTVCGPRMIVDVPVILGVSELLFC